MAPFQLISAWHQILKLLQRYLHGINKNYKLYQVEDFSLFGFQRILRKSKVDGHGSVWSTLCGRGFNWTVIQKTEIEQSEKVDGQKDSLGKSTVLTLNYGRSKLGSLSSLKETNWTVRKVDTF